MTSKLTITREQATDKEIQMLIDSHENGTAMFLRVDAYYLMAKELQERRKAAMDGEPVFILEVARADYKGQKLGNHFGFITLDAARELKEGNYQLYRHAQPAPKTEREPIAWLNDAYLARGVVDGEAGSEDAGPGYIPVYREPATQPAPVVPEKATVGEMPFLGASEGVYVRGWNDCRAAMLQENPKSAGESNNCRRSEKVQDLLAGNCRENGNSSTGTAITPVAPDKKLTDDVLDEIIAGAKTSMEQYLALSLKAEREVWRKEGPTDDERIMAIEGIHNCERCGDEGWVVGEMGIMRCACGQAGTLINEGTIQAGNSPVITGAEQRIADAVELLQKAAPAMLADNSGPDGPLAGRLKSPVIPDGYVMVPKAPSQAHLNSIAMRYRHDFYLLNDAQKDSALATARQMYEECSGQGFYTLPAAPQEVK